MEHAGTGREAFASRASRLLRSVKSVVEIERQCDLEPESCKELTAMKHGLKMLLFLLLSCTHTGIGGVRRRRVLVLADFEEWRVA